MQTSFAGNYEKRWYLLLHFPGYLECLKRFLNIPFHRTKFIKIYSTRRQGWMSICISQKLRRPAVCDLTKKRNVNKPGEKQNGY